MGFKEKIQNLGRRSLNDAFFAPKDVKTTKAKVFYYYFKLVYLRSVGQGQVIGRFTEMIPELGWILLFIEKFTSVSLSVSFIIWIIVLSQLLVIIIGFIWAIVLKADKVEAMLALERSPFQKEVYDRIVKEGEEL